LERSSKRLYEISASTDMLGSERRPPPTPLNCSRPNRDRI
jgi:hypothetical protein